MASSIKLSFASFFFVARLLATPIRLACRAIVGVGTCTNHGYNLIGKLPIKRILAMGTDNKQYFSSHDFSSFSCDSKIRRNKPSNNDRFLWFRTMNVNLFVKCADNYLISVVYSLGYWLYPHSTTSYVNAPHPNIFSYACQSRITHTPINMRPRKTICCQRTGFLTEAKIPV